MFSGRAAEALGEAIAQEIERGPGLVQGRRFGDAVEKDFIGVAVGEGEREMPLDCLAQSASSAVGREEIFSGLQAQRFQDVVAMTITLVHRGRGCTGGSSNSAHGERFFAATGPQARGGVEDALFQFGVGMAGQISSKESGIYYLHGVSLTLYTKRTRHN
jgi:hypothetical protein